MSPFRYDLIKLFFVILFVLLAIWAVWRAPKLLIGWRNARKRRQELLQERATFVSEAMKSIRSGDAAAPSTKKPLVYLPEVLPEKPAEVPPTSSPWLSILDKPTTTIRQIVAFDPQYHVILIACLYGIDGLLNEKLRAISLGSNSAVARITLLIALIAGPLFGIFSVALVSWVVRFVASLLDGTASDHETQAAFAWSLVPHVYTLPLTLAATLALNSGVGKTLLAANAIASIVAHVWYFILWLNTLAEVNRFSRWKAFLTMLLAMVVLAAAAF